MIQYSYAIPRDISPIESFSGKYRFLSNFYPATVVYEGFVFPSVEHGFVAGKYRFDKFQVDRINKLSAGQAKRYGREAILPSSWNTNRNKIMVDLVTAKFESSLLMDMLRSTDEKILIEGNTWGDTYWGECPIGTGKNQLGKILMNIRDGEFDGRR